MMPTSKRMMNGKQWKQPKMFDELPNGLWGLSCYRKSSACG